MNKSNNETTINYAGYVSTKHIQYNETVAQTSHNAGQSPLFHFLLSALSGQFKDSLRPKYIVLYDSNGSCCNKVAYDAISEIIEDNTVVIHFSIPYSYLNPGTKEIISARLYNDKYIASDDLDKACAVTTFENAISIENDQGNYNLYVDWTLSLKDLSSAKDVVIKQ